MSGRFGKAYKDSLDEGGDTFCENVGVAASDPFEGYMTEIDDRLEDATAVLDASHVGQHDTQAVDEACRRVEHDTLEHRVREADPLYCIQGSSQLRV